MSAKPVTIRFHLERERDRKAWERLQQMRKQEQCSLSRALILLLSQSEGTSSQPLSPEAFAQAVMSGLQTRLPAFIAGCLSGISAAMPGSPTESHAPEPDDEPDFSRSHADWNIIGE